MQLAHVDDVHARKRFRSTDGVEQDPRPEAARGAPASAEPGARGCHGRKRRRGAALTAAIGLAMTIGICESTRAGITTTFAFNLGSGGFTTSPQGIYTPPAINDRWTYRVAGPKAGTPPFMTGSNTQPTWNVLSSPVSGTAVATGNHLTSPVIQLDATVDQFILRVAHRYRFPADGSVVNRVTLPQAAGQIEYSLDRQPFLPLGPGDWKQAGPVDVSLQPHVTRTNWGSLSVPTFVPGVGSTPPIYLLANGGASFTGETNGFDAGNFAGSETRSIAFPGGTKTVEFRFTNVNLGNSCGINGGWDVSFLEATFIEAPEPGGFALAVTGGVAAACGCIARRPRQARRGGATSGPPGRA